MAVLIDTGILLRLFERNDPHHAAIRRALTQLRRQGEPLMTTAQNIAEFWNVSTRPASARGGFGHDGERTARRVRIIEQVCDVLTESAATYARWKELLSSHSIQGAAVHDARLAAVMLEHGVATILTLNSADFSRYSGITATSPAGG
ncbi:MAG: type II toxin-antitoxin system VapC family toxin [Planctomycetaceae bacterium]|nr:type II toxin-antitoxin system VapC family toxin [Planctomycetaceae bacterium]